MLSQENSFLSEELLNRKQAESARGNLELELLSNEETQELVQAILHKAIKSQSLFNHVINSQEFGCIIEKYEQIFLQHNRTPTY